MWNRELYYWGNVVYSQKQIWERKLRARRGLLGLNRLLVSALIFMNLLSYPITLSVVGKRVKCWWNIYTCWEDAEPQYLPKPFLRHNFGYTDRWEVSVGSLDTYSLPLYYLLCYLPMCSQCCYKERERLGFWVLDFCWWMGCVVDVVCFSPFPLLIDVLIFIVIIPLHLILIGSS